MFHVVYAIRMADTIVVPTPTCSKGVGMYCVRCRVPSIAGNVSAVFVVVRFVMLFFTSLLLFRLLFYVIDKHPYVLRIV